MGSAISNLDGPQIIVKKAQKGLKDAPIYGPCQASIPNYLVTFLINDPRFDWVFSENDGIEKFAELNPQFLPQNRGRYTHEQLCRMPLKNRDGWGHSQLGKEVKC